MSNNLFEQSAERLKNQQFGFAVSEEDSETDTDQDIFSQAVKNVQPNFTFMETVKDVAEQIPAKGLKGAAGSYGNILEFLGLQTPEQLLPGQKARLEAAYESDTDLGLDDEILPSYHRLPTSQQAGQAIESITGVGEGKTPAGRIAGRGAEFIGETAILPGGATPKALASVGVGGLAGQSARELGAPEAVATGLEIGIPLAAPGIANKLSPKKGTEFAKIVEQGRKLGLTDKELTPLIQGETKTSVLGKVARKTEDTKKQFQSIKSKLGDSYDKLKSEPIATEKLPNNMQVDLKKQFSTIRNNLQDTLGVSPDRQAAIDYVEGALTRLRNTRITPKTLIETWQDINRSVNWGKIPGGKKALSELKTPIMNTLETISPELARDFEITNNLYAKYANISSKLKPDLIDKIFTVGEVSGIVPAAGAMIFGNPWPLVGLGGEFAIRQLSKEMLTNPYFQNVATKMVKEANAGNFKAIKDLTKNAKEMMQRKYPDSDWEFMLEDASSE